MAITTEQPQEEWADTISLVSESAESCLSSLSGLWSELGLGEKERNQACQTLVHNVRKVFDDTIKDAQETKAQVISKMSIGDRSWPVYIESIFVITNVYGPRPSNFPKSIFTCMTCSCKASLVSHACPC